ncbi:MAG TPA: hypothetical protein VGI10_13290 [Polyangiaceae bacterium]|jgi:hypothetical protein
MSDGPRNVYYRYTDASGRLHVVDSLSLVPASERGSVEKVELGAGSAPSGPSLGGAPDARSFVLGAVAALALIALFRWLPRTMRFMLRFGIVAGLAALLLSGYFGWLRRSAGHTDSALTTPQVLIGDAKGAVDKMNERMRAQDQQIKDIEQQSK